MIPKGTLCLIIKPNGNWVDNHNCAGKTCTVVGAPFFFQHEPRISYTPCDPIAFVATLCLQPIAPPVPENAGRALRELVRMDG